MPTGGGSGEPVIESKGEGMSMDAAMAELVHSVPVL